MRNDTFHSERPPRDEKNCGIVENNTTKSGRARTLESVVSCEAKPAATTYITERTTTLPRFYRRPRSPFQRQVEDCHFCRSCATVEESSRLHNPQSQSRRVVARVKKRVKQVVLWLQKMRLIPCRTNGQSNPRVLPTGS